MQVYYTARADLARLTADYDARADERSLKAMLSARVAYDHAAEVLEIHESQHQCGAAVRHA